MATTMETQTTMQPRTVMTQQAQQTMRPVTEMIEQQVPRTVMREQRTSVPRQRAYTTYDTQTENYTVTIPETTYTTEYQTMERMVPEVTTVQVPQTTTEMVATQVPRMIPQETVQMVPQTTTEMVATQVPRTVVQEVQTVSQ